MIFTIGVFLASLILLLAFLPKPKASLTQQQARIMQFLQYDKLKQEAQTIGWNLSVKELGMIVTAAASVGILISILIGNVFFIVIGAAIAFQLPKFIILKIKKKRHMNLLIELPDNLKILVSRLQDFASIRQALKASLPDMGGVTKPYFVELYNSLQLNIPVEDALLEMVEKLKIRKFNDFCEKLIMANSEGFDQSLDSLRMTIDIMSEDIREIKKLEIRSKSEKRRLWSIIGVTWFIPLALSFLNSDNGNIFLESLHGQIVIASFFFFTLVAIAKGDDYLSLNVEEL